jgi:P4 family phage/plasmid primase-like protien
LSSRTLKQYRASEKPMIDKQRVLERLDMREYFAQYFPQARSGRTEISVCSPFRNDEHPSLAINAVTGLWCDHGNGDSGDVFDFEQRMSRCDFPTAVEKLAHRAGMNGTPDPNTETGIVRTLQSHGFKVDAARWSATLFEANGLAARSFLNARGLTDDTLQRYGVGYDERMKAVTIPLVLQGEQIASLKRMFFDGQGQPTGQARWRSKNGKKDFRNYGQATLYCFELAKNADSVIVCEGELDCLLLRQHGLDAVTGTSGAGTWKPAWSEHLRGKGVTLAYDSDEPGRKSAVMVAGKLQGIARTIRIANLFPKNEGSDKDRKDVTDFFRLGGTVEGFTAILAGATEYKPDATPPDAEAEPRLSQARIADEILEEHELIYVGGSFYRYGSGIWRKDAIRFVEREIKRHCGLRANRSLIESIKYLAALECQIEESDLNADRMLFNFRNGLLNLRTDSLEPHSPDQLSTIQFPFEFQPDGSCVRWTRFLDEVFQGNDSLSLLLQEIFGYVLIPDTSMQKMFWFVGEGANGKGVAIKVLEELIDKSNRTCVDIRNLHNPFVRAALHNKLLAVQGDFPRKFFGNEDLIKTFVGGDSMDAQEKFKPQFEFIPFCRFIFAMNTLPETKDLSKGFFRRVVIVPFTRTFAEDEQDRRLLETLQKELPGIFLWALEGLKRLVENKRFTESPDALRALENYKQEHNTVGQFVESECVLGPEAKCKGSEFWSAYELFSAESGVEALSRKEFAVQLKRGYPVTVKTHRWGDESGPARTYFGIGLRGQ